MLRSLKDLEGYTASATDGDIGRVVNFLLDDARWTIRYLIVEPGSFLDGAQVLVSPISFREVEWATHRFHLALTKEKVLGSPSVDLHKPVSRQHEEAFSRYYGFPWYWRSSGLWGTASFPSGLAEDADAEASATPPAKPGDVHLRSSRDVRGYRIQGSDGPIGHVEDFIVDDGTWQVRYLVVDTSDWWFGRRVLVAPDWATRISWAGGTVTLDLSREEIRTSPEWDPAAPPHSEYESRLRHHYGRTASGRASRLL
ncbi:MAG: PRC-barrel domain-containing protein [Holophagales bacterium]|nr:PRC-barrel domain-containing protein [Holophagales bacterium]